MEISQKSFPYGDTSLSVEEAISLAEGKQKGHLSKEGRNRIAKNEAALQEIVSKDVAVYGINTGFGPLCSTRIPKDDLQKLQHNLLKSHSVGVGDPLPRPLVRLMIVLKIQSLALGFSGVSISLIERLMWHLSKDLTPLVPSQGSLGASGDLAPLAHMSLPLIGEGKLWDGKYYVDTTKLLRKHKLQPLNLQPKEGLALINGTQFIAAHAVSTLQRLHFCLEQADILAAMSLEALLGSVQPFSEKLHQLRPYRGAQLVASRVRLLLKDSEMLSSHSNCERVQDPYSFRCVAQVHGASREAWRHLKKQTICEINAVTDNPIILGRGETVSGGNFHGQLLALPLDYATIAAAELGSISERRMYRLSEGGYDGLPKLLLKNTGLNSGFMMPHYTAAALVSENKTLAHPASVDSIPTSLGQEDHVSMGAWAGRKCLLVIENIEKILSIEYLYAAQSFEYRRPRRSSLALEEVYTRLRSEVKAVTEDRPFLSDIERALTLLQKGKVLEATQKHIDKKAWLPKAYNDFTLQTADNKK